jgi:ribosome-associated translation inhibitor RaiA
MPRSHRQRTQRRAPLGTATTARPRAARGRTPAAETPLTIIAPEMGPAPAFREYVRQRAGFHLGKLALSIDRVTVRLHRISGPKGAPAFRCRVKLVLPRLETIVVEEVKRAPEDAYDRAIDGAERALRRALTRRRRRARRPRSG